MKKIKTYNTFINESLKDKLKGKSREELIDNIKDLSPTKQLSYSDKYNILSKKEIYNIIKKFPTQEQFYNACKYGILSIVKQSIKDGEEIDSKHLGAASSNGHLDVINYLLDNKLFDYREIENAIWWSKNVDVIEIMHKYLRDNNIKKKETLNESLKDKIKGKSREEILDAPIFKGKNDEEIFILACKHGIMWLVLDMVKKGIDITSNGMGGFYNAVRHGHYKIVNFLLNQEQIINSLDNEFIKFIMFKMIMKDDFMVKLLLNNDAIKKHLTDDDIKIIGNYLDDSLNESLKDKLKGKSHEEIMKSIEDLSDDEALNKFCGRNYDEGIKYLINKGMSYRHMVNMLIRFCGFSGNLDLIKLLVDKGLNIKNIDTNSLHTDPLSYAVKNNNIQIVKYLIEHGMDINGINGGPIASSIAKGYYDIFKYLIGKGAKLNGTGQDLMGYAISSGNLDIIKYLLDNGFTIPDDKKYKYFENVVIHSRNPELVKFIFDKAKIKIKNNQILFDSINYNGEDEIIKLLHQNKPKNPNKPIHGSNRTPKYIKNMSIGDISESAVLTNCLDCIKYLVEEKNGSEYITGVELRWSSYMGYYDIVKYLLENDLTNGDWNVKQSIILAKLNKQDKTVELLKQYEK